MGKIDLLNALQPGMCHKYKEMVVAIFGIVSVTPIGHFLT